MLIYLIFQILKINSQFDYENQDSWTGLCLNGNRQSPVNFIFTQQQIITKQLESGQSQFKVKFKDNIQVSLDDYFDSFKLYNFSEPYQFIGNLKLGYCIADYQFQYLLFHTPSQTRLNNVTYEAQLHIVARLKQKKTCQSALQYLILGFLFQKNVENLNQQNQFLKELNIENNQNQHKANLLSLINNRKQKKSITYKGSLTYPPCTQNVRWIIDIQPINISSSQAQMFFDLRQSLGNSSRDFQQNSSLFNMIRFGSWYLINFIILSLYLLI